MRVGVLQLALGEQGTGMGERLDDADIGGAFLALGRQDRLAAEQRQGLAIGAVGLDVVGHRQVVPDAQDIVVLTVRRRGMDKSGARVVGDMLAGEEGDVVVPLALGVGVATEGVGEGHAIEMANTAKSGCATICRFKGILGQRIRQKENLSLGRSTPLTERVHTIHAIRDGGIERDGPVLRDGPRCSRPDDYLGPLKMIEERRSVITGVV